jgi:hypothetical protein
VAQNTVRPDTPAKLIHAKAEAVESDAIRKHMHDGDRTEGRGAKTGDWMIQIGAYKAKKQAREQLATIQHKYAAQLKAGRPDIESAPHGYYRARIVGLSAQAAQKACDLISAHRTACDVYEPNA